jgi:serine/threonine protein kinase
MPKKVGKYELGKTLGSGSFSKVKLGVDEQGNQYAVKIIDKAQLAREHMEEQLKREIAVMKMLNHPNVVKLYEVMQTQNNIYLVLELVTGGELFERIVTAKRFDEDTGRKFFQQLVVGLHYCHKQGVAHRDLKPENLLLSDKDQLKIMDFGLSNMQKGGVKEQNSGSLLNTVCGTPNYVAPEVLKEQGYNGITADVWSCGVILFVMLAGYLPFDDPNMNHLFNKIERGDFRMAKHFTDPAKDLIGKMMVVDPMQRITLDQILSHPWFAVGFDKRLITEFNNATPLAPSQQQIQNWATNEKEVTTEAKQPATPATVNDGSIGTFELISRLTSGVFNTMVTGGKGGPTGGAAVNIKRATRFMMSGNAKDAAAKIQSVLDSMKAKGSAPAAAAEAQKPTPASPKPAADANEIKGFVNAPKGLLTYVVTIVPIVGGDICMIELRRGRGDTFDFHDFYHKLQAGLGAGVISKEIGGEPKPAA